MPGELGARTPLTSLGLDGPRGADVRPGIEGAPGANGACPSKGERGADGSFGAMTAVSCSQAFATEAATKAAVKLFIVFICFVEI